MLAAYVLLILVGGLAGDLLYLRKYTYAVIRLLIALGVIAWISVPAIIQDIYIQMDFILQHTGGSVPGLQGIRDFGRYILYGYWGLCLLDIVLIPFWVNGHNRVAVQRI